MAGSNDDMAEKTRRTSYGTWSCGFPIAFSCERSVHVVVNASPEKYWRGELGSLRS